MVAPATPADAYGMLKTAIRDDDPVLFCENLVMYNVTGPIPDDPGYTVPFGRAQVVREGSDLTIVAHSYTVQRALRVADRLAQDGVAAEVVDLRSLRPLDVDTVAESVRKTNRVVVAEEGWSTFGVGAELAARISARVLRRPGRAGRAGRLGRGADALLQAAGAGRAAAGVEDRGGGAQPARATAASL